MTNTYTHQFPTHYKMRPQETFSWNDDGLLIALLACTIVVTVLTLIATWR
jgi:hypothetical protein